MAYGIANPPETPTPATVEAMLDRAWAGGITAFDTAPAYGEAEDRLGRWIKKRGISPHVVSKLPSLHGVPDADAAKAVDEAIRGTVSRLRVRPATYLAHDAADYLRPAIRERLHAAAARGEVGAVGMSAYTEAEVRASIAAGPPHAIELPVSALDQRLVSGGAVAACAAAGITVFARSVFLQGVMLMPPGRLPAALAALRTSIETFETLAAEAETTRPSIALRFVRDLSGVSSIVIGAYDLDQLDALIAAAAEPPLAAGDLDAIAAIARAVPLSLLDPRTWAAKA